MEQNIPKNELQCAFLDALYLGNGIHDILKIAEMNFKNPIFVYNTSYQLIAASSMTTDIPEVLEKVRDTSFLNSEEVARMEKHNVMDKIYENRSAFWGQDKDYPDRIWMLCSLRIKNALIGYIIVLSGNNIPTQDELDLLTMLSRVLSIELQKHDFFTNKTGLKYEYFLTALLDGQFDNRDTITTRLQALDGHLLPNIYVICISAPDNIDNNFFNKTIATKARSCFPNCMSVVYQNNLVLLVSHKQLLDFYEKGGKTFLQFLKLNQIKAGISQPFWDILYVPFYYRQAKECLSLGLMLKPETEIYLAEDYLPYQLMKDAVVPKLHTLQHHLFLKLKEYDASYNTELLPTLKEYLMQNRNSTAAADALNIHRTTFFYRVKKIEEVLDISISDCKTLFQFELSFLIEDYLDKMNIE